MDIEKVKKTRSRAGYGLLSGVIGIFLNFMLFALKLGVGLVIGSVAVMADAFNNLADAASSIVTIVGFRLASKPADRDHPFGHGRIEEVAGLIIAMTMIFVGFEFGRTSIENIITPEPLYFSWIAVGILAFGFIVKLWMFFFNRRLGKKISSNALLAVAADARIDCVISAFTVSAIFIAHFTSIYIDGWAGLAVSLFIFYQGYASARECISAIIGKAADPETVQAIKGIVSMHPDVLGAHDLVVHNYGANKSIATIHVEVDTALPLCVCHKLSEKLCADVLEELGISLTVHFDPIDTDCSRRNAVCAYLAGNYPNAHAHGFRVSKNGISLKIQLPKGFEKSEQSNIEENIKKVLSDANVTIMFEEDWF